MENKDVLSNSHGLAAQLTDLSIKIDTNENFYSPIELKNKFSPLFNDLYNESHTDNYFWEYCPLKVYESNYDKRKKEYLAKYFDASEKDFIELEIVTMQNLSKEKDAIINPYTYEIIQPYLDGYTYSPFLEDIFLKEYIFNDVYNKIEFSQRAKLKFLEHKLFEIEFNPGKTPLIQENKEVEIDETKKNIAESVRYLYEFGILEHLSNQLKTETTESENKLAFVLSKIMNEDQTTIQSYLNGITNDSQNNPLREKQIMKLEELLIHKGFDKRIFQTNKNCDSKQQYKIPFNKISEK